MVLYFKDNYGHLEVFLAIKIFDIKLNVCIKTYLYVLAAEISSSSFEIEMYGWPFFFWAIEETTVLSDIHN